MLKSFSSQKIVRCMFFRNLLLGETVYEYIRNYFKLQTINKIEKEDKLVITFSKSSRIAKKVLLFLIEYLVLSKLQNHEVRSLHYNNRSSTTRSIFFIPETFESI